MAGLISVRSLRVDRGLARVLITAGFLISLLMIVLANHLGGDTGRGVASAWGGLLLLFIVVVILRHILSADSVTLQSIYGVISAYLIIGLMFSSFYSAMYFLQGKSFFAGGQPGSSTNFQYFSFTTLTTLGYGDFTAKYNPGRAIAMLEAMTGQIFLATLVAKLVGSFRPGAAAAKEAAAGPDQPD